ncbi:MAG: ABC transporter ATP-binding protein [Candidatus Doudnabacteria bacterium]|nr:ABC transporter ATP-binding protein [Candidatus Doudnabacteria bacterium]
MTFGRMFWRNLKVTWQASRVYFLGIAVAASVEAAVGITSIFAFSQIIDAGTKLAANDTSAGQRILVSFGVLVACSVINTFLGQAQLYLGEVHKQRVIDHIDKLVIAKLGSLPASFVESAEFQDKFKMIELFSKDKFINTVEVRLPTLFRSVANLIYAGVAMLLQSPGILGVILVTQFLFVSWVIKENGKFYALVEEWTPIRRQKDYFISLTHDLGVFTNLKVYSLFPYLLRKVRGLQDELHKRNNNYRKVFRVQAVIASLLTYLLSNLATRGYYVWLLVTGAVTLGQFSFYFQKIFVC